MNERRCRQAAQLFADLARAREAALATARAGYSPFAQHMLAQSVHLNEVSCHQQLHVVVNNLQMCEPAAALVLTALGKKCSALSLDCWSQCKAQCKLHMHVHIHAATDVARNGQVRPPVLLPGKGNILMYDLLCAKFESYISVGLLGVAFKQQADVLPMTEDLYHKARAWPGAHDMASW